MQPLPLNPVDLALTSQRLPADGWQFVESSKRDAGGHYGQVVYKNRMVNVVTAVRAGGWVFCLEQAVLGFYVSWALGGFHEQDHYTFKHLEAEQQPGFNDVFETWVDGFIQGTHVVAL